MISFFRLTKNRGLSGVEITPVNGDSEPTSSTSQGNDSSDFVQGSIIGFVLGSVFFAFLIAMTIDPKTLRLERKILSEKILMTKELMKGIEYPNQIIRQMDAVLDYDFIEHGVMKNFQEEETMKAIFKHSINDPLAMDKLMKLSCTEDHHARIYIAGKCSKVNQAEDIIQKCKALYEGE